MVLAAKLRSKRASISLIEYVERITIKKQLEEGTMDCGNGFSTSGPCGVSFIGGGGQPWAVVGTTAGSTPALEGSAVALVPQGAEHAALSLNYQTQLNIQQFTITFTFTPNGQNVCLVIQNSTNNPYGFNGKTFSAGAGCEAGFFQGYGQPPPDHVFALELDSRSQLRNSDPYNSFTYSSTQIYFSGESPCLPDQFSGQFPIKDKISTSPVPLCSPANASNTTTGHIYTATVTYDGSNLSLDLYDTTASGQHFTQTWTDVDIPGTVGADLAWVGFTGATYSGGGSIADLLINSFSYSNEAGGGPPPNGGGGGTPPETAPFTGTITVGGVTYQLSGTATAPPAKVAAAKVAPTKTKK